ncbi:MAG: Flp pilus assembly complex ATPase component TadA, partial [Silvanigrellaceae bacterium]|nr:Flp pilus assembly complex ATPase component TadA [Silvanigrellaceae bacterium]
MWILKDNIKQKISYSEPDILFSIGHTDDCEIRVENYVGESFFIQILTFHEFIFVLNHDQVSVCFEAFHFKNFGIDVSLNYQESIKNFKKKILLDDRLSEVFNSDIFIKILKEVQFYELEHLNILSLKDNHYGFLYRIINIATEFLNKVFWQEHDPMKLSDRLLFVHIIWCVWAQMSGFGIITSALIDPSVSEIMVNSFNHIYLERHGIISRSKLAFQNQHELLAVIERMCSQVGRRIDESVPYCDARLEDGARIHAILPPIALNGPCLTIRKFVTQNFSPKELISLGSLDQKVL